MLTNNALCNKCDVFFKIATLVSDLAARTLVSRLSGEGLNLPAARLAASGAKDLIFYSVKEIADELEKTAEELEKDKKEDEK